ncbi:hypothetical protein [Szabonella alba]|uniref:4,5-dihydroxyphthalate decarboxylase n=1 Tax=Szabonella alba TaxID=2804194 RepID=A0A8K0Y2T6_9RHOB|nr:hypothetical protein [Szabonella alba]MBL4919189.1 hypothetical protein [Szabonella alba]
MSRFALHLACADYSRVMPLAAGIVRPERIDLTLTLGRNGSWPDRANILARILRENVFHGGESSMGGHLLRVLRGDRSFVALPVFILRTFGERDLYVAKDGPIRTAADLIGKRMGLYSWVASGAVWYRHAMVNLGVPLEAVEWWVGDVNAAGETSHAADLPEKVKKAPDFLSKLLADGQIDAMWSPPRPNGFDPDNGPITRLFPDFRPVEETYFNTTGIFPMQHLIILRRDVWDAAPWIGKSLVQAFQASNAAFEAAQTGFPDAFPWMAAEIPDTRAILGEDPYSHGLTDRNIHALETFIAQALDAGIIDRSVSVDQYFADYLRASGE